MEPADVERELRGLAERVRILEDRLGVAVPAAALPPSLPSVSAGGWSWQRLGIALIGLGGAYVLRALVEAGTLPTRPGVGAGLVYALAWLAAGARLREPLYAAVSALAFGPLIWEATARFHVVNAWTAAALLFASAVVGHLLSIATISTLTALATGCALLISTHDVVPFTTLFLAIAAGIELAACLQHWLSERWVAAAVVDAAVLFATWLATNPRGLPEGYAAIPHGWVVGAQVTLLGIFLASTIVRTLVRHFTVTAFEMAQCAAAFAITMWSGLPVAAVMLGAGAACYIVSFVVLERGGGRNFYAYSTFGLLLVAAGMPSAAVWLSAAVVCSWSRRTTLEAHGLVYLGLGLTVAPAWAGAIAAALGYAGARRSPLRIPMFAAAVWTVAQFGATIAPENLRVAAKLVAAGAGLIALPRVIASRGGGSECSGTTLRPRDSAAKSDTASSAG